MGHKKYLNIAIGVISLLALGALALAIYANNTPVPVAPVAAQPTGPAKVSPTSATGPVTSPVTITSATLPSTVTATNAPVTTPTVTVTPIITLTPASKPFTTPPVTTTGKVVTGQQYPWTKYWPGVKVVRADGPPIVSQEVALRAMLTQMNAADFSIVSDTEEATCFV